jgi:ankyrin repeat protein
LLLDRGAHVSEVDHDGWTALHHAGFRGSGAVAQLLLRRGADPMARSQTFCTPLHVACVAAQRETVALLVLAGTQLDYKVSSGVDASRFL